VFDVLEGALQSHPYFKSQAAAAAAAAAASAAATPASTAVSPLAGTPKSDSQQQDEGPSAATGALGGVAAAASGDASGAVAGADAGEDGSGPGLAVVNTATMLTAVRKDRTTFMDQVGDTVQRATPSSPTGGQLVVAGCSLLRVEVVS
jgi:hypothetical protein